MFSGIQNYEETQQVFIRHDTFKAVQYYITHFVQCVLAFLTFTYEKLFSVCHKLAFLYS